MESLGPALTDKWLCEFKSNRKESAECPSHCLKDFLHSLPAIATVKNPEERLLCINTEYTRVLGKSKSEVENHLPAEIWGRPFAGLIMAHDELVRRTRQSYLFIENVPTRAGRADRLNLRFPIFDSDGQIEMTGTLGFDYELMRRGMRLLESPGPAAQAYLFVPIEEDDSLKQVFSAR
jgi:hypothetical protein